jgi:hypothetical protein
MRLEALRRAVPLRDEDPALPTLTLPYKIVIQGVYPN